LLQVRAGNPILHLRGKADKAAFVGFSTAIIDGFEATAGPLNLKEWGYARTFYRVPSRDFVLLSLPMPLWEVFVAREAYAREA
jgi:putative restriction endonuclease